MKERGFSTAEAKQCKLVSLKARVAVALIFFPPHYTMV